MGNPNAGKSVVFNSLTGMYVDVSNYPGTTVDVHWGRLGKDLLIDTPGIYGVSMFNDEEEVARRIILEADCIINVVDGVRLHKDLFLTLQLIDLGLPMVVALNMMDELQKCRMQIDIEKLETLLGVPVIPMVAVRGQGLDKLKDAIRHPRRGLVDPWLRSQLVHLHREHAAIGSPREALLVLENDPELTRKYNVYPKIRERIYGARRRRADWIVEQCVRKLPDRKKERRWLERLLTQPLTGFPLFILIMVILYFIVGVLVAQLLVGFLEEGLFQGVYEPWISSLVSRMLPQASIFAQLLVGPFGALTMAVTYLFGLLLPLVLGFHLSVGFLEDSGYLPRVAVLADRGLNKIGLNGKAVIPLLLGFGCVTMALVSTRILGSKREQTIATALLCLVIPCSSQMGIIMIMLASLGLRAMLFYLLLMLLVFILAGLLLSWFLPGRSTQLFIDLPPLRWPRFSNVLKKALSRSVSFLKDAGPLFLAASLLIGGLEWMGLLPWLERLFAPLTVSWLLLPKETTVPFIMGLLRRDLGAAGLYSLDLSPQQMLVSLTTITFFVPCIASMLVLFKERGVKQGVCIFIGTLASALLLGGLVARLLV